MYALPRWLPRALPENRCLGAANRGRSGAGGEGDHVLDRRGYAYVHFLFRPGVVWCGVVAPLASVGYSARCVTSLDYVVPTSSLPRGHDVTTNQNCAVYTKQPIIGKQSRAHHTDERERHAQEKHPRQRLGDSTAIGQAPSCKQTHVAQPLAFGRCLGWRRSRSETHPIQHRNTRSAGDRKREKGEAWAGNTDKSATKTRYNYASRH